VTGSHKHREATRTPCSRISPNATCTTILYLGMFCALMEREDGGKGETIRINPSILLR